MAAPELDAPPRTVVETFGGTGSPVVLRGGTGGRTYRAGEVVLKQVSNLDEAEWASALFERIDGPGFRVPRPVRARDGRWVVDGWQASEFVEGAHAGRNGGRWPETIAACRAFHAALAGEPRPPFLDERDDGWAEADRLAFGGLTREAPAPFAEPIARLSRVLAPVAPRSQVIHGDFTANVLFSEGEAPCVIDFSPYWRPAEFALAVVVSDALSWAAADPEIIDLCADITDFPQWLARATLRRVWELDCHTRRGWPNRKDYLHEYLPTIALIERLAGARSPQSRKGH